MSNNTNEETEVKEFVDTVEVEPTTDDELVETQDENETQPETSAGENEEEEVQEEEEVEEEKQPTDEEEQPPIEEEEIIKDVPGETPKERALRAELTKLRKDIRIQQQQELLKKDNLFVKKEEDILSEYDPEEIAKLDKILASKGYVKKGELEAQSFEQSANEQLKSFLDSHPEYKPENDKDGLLWNQFRERYQILNVNPKDPKVLKDVFNMVHNSLHGSSSIDIKKIKASQAKINVASHSGGANTSGTKITKKESPTGLRIDMLKGFEEEDLKDLI